MRAAIYACVSTTSTSYYGDALAFVQRLEVQVEPLRRLADQHGWIVTEIYSDRESGAKEARPGLALLMRDARRRRFDVVIVWRFDRLSRGVTHFLQLVEELRQLGIDFVSLEQSFDTTTPIGKFASTMFSVLAELEGEVIRDRVRAGLEYARANGTKSGNPIGRPKLVFRRDEVRELRNQGHSWREIGRKLGISATTARRALQNPPEGGKP